MSEIAVLDASALLALLNDEPGAAAVMTVLPGALMSAVNAAEVVSKLCERGVPEQVAALAIGDVGVEIVPFDGDQARLAGGFRPLTRHAGLSLGDRCCLALAKVNGAEALTTERIWPAIAETVDVTIRMIRPGN